MLTAGALRGVDDYSAISHSSKCIDNSGVLFYKSQVLINQEIDNSDGINLNLNKNSLFPRMVE